MSVGESSSARAVGGRARPQTGVTCTSPTPTDTLQWPRTSDRGRERLSRIILVGDNHKTVYRRHIKGGRGRCRWRDVGLIRRMQAEMYDDAGYRIKV